MHLASFNLADLLISLWRGQLSENQTTDPIAAWPWAVLRGATWEQHGKAVAGTTPYLPGSFDRPPRNIADKINSGYKAWEWLLYLYGLAPALLYDILPQPYYSHFCKLVRAMRIIQQYHIKTPDLVTAQHLLQSFAHEFETLYYQRRINRLHFCRPSIHALLHLASEVTRLGPPICSSQWTMERTIGNLGEEMRQPSNPYANLSQRGLLRCQVNALVAMIPDLEQTPPALPRGALDLGKGFALLRAQDRYSRAMRPCEARALAVYIQNLNGSELAPGYPKVTRWARLRLPNGQIARSQWKEAQKPLNKVRMARNVKVRQEMGLAIVSAYSEPNPDLLAASEGAFVSCQSFGDDALVAVNVLCIQSVVAMVPHTLPHSVDSERHFFLVERPGLDFLNLGMSSTDNIAPFDT
ncbi:hypothetical protein HYPSUDRAFT_151868 [Hypholoma sublateritium FD-334 SS-4]|uniref:Uncharacterized protein n=1 Tax=Hypholoma sublateritium (strain FD-334 SS-4) TaxID=945553 RepID=A0A0D2N934_HYPSF|nr:hypothetical protein HYPSUDRAFT_151868 [Hypholoma sublateritium FD-334 SS-4]